jgi:hypothetical protein
MIDGRLERPIEASGWPVPLEVWIDGNTLRFLMAIEDGRRGALAATPSVATPSRGMLENFIRLSDAPPTRILAFAQRHGTLGVTKKKPPSGSYFRSPRAKDLQTFGYAYLALDATIEPEGSEQIDVWRFWSHKMKLALLLAAKFSAGEVGDIDVWRDLMGEPEFEFHGLEPDTHLKECVNHERGMLAEYIADWLELGWVHFFLNGFDQDKFKLEFQTPSLFGGLALQLASVVCESGGFAICAGCANPFAPRRAPRKAHRNYCDECRRRKVPVRDAVRALRERRTA